MDYFFLNSAFFLQVLEHDITYTVHQLAQNVIKTNLYSIIDLFNMT